MASIPSRGQYKHLRACLLCSIVQQPTDFKKNRCPNCEEIMQMKGSTDRISVCATTYFDGIIAVIDPETSKYVRGTYAVRVKGHVPEDVEAELESRGIKYRPRDQTDQD
ncbi:hypothetical protein PISMIDRAFT_680881 [Pisolithus microcarpus 441]|uniref:Transcription elongation factor SPT4 n=1 Tax=Pisolithus microcarpus 441 TaxID=765257 RepID=A0A0C9YB08_9AGAM|nr:Spt4/RpoE2 zinc finger-domain-containing protein [Pisolithus microcarpus]KIK21920.1 hypothetical protein PISMIDRAFT_680881 [Pisolithus microcarpus 441]